MNKILVFLLFSAAAVFSQISSTNNSSIKNSVSIHPDSLTFGELNWKIPDGKEFRKTIGDIPFYYEKDNSVALFYLQLSFEAGTLLENPQPEGTASLYSLSIRNGGSQKFSPAVVDSLLALNAVSISVSSGLTRTDFRISGLSENLETALGILEDILQNPSFDSTRLDLNRANLSQKTAHRFDNPSAVLSAGWRSIIYPNSVYSRLLSVDYPEQITKSDLVDYHNFVMKNAKMIVAASGDINENVVKKFVQKNFGKKRTVNPHNLPEILPAKTPSALIIHKEGLNQAFIATGVPSFKRPDDRFYPLTVFNEILGGGGFNSRLVSQVRSDAGLTYSIYSQFSGNYKFDGVFNATLFTKSESLNHALGLTQKIIFETANEELTPTEVDEKKTQFILSLPSSFRTSENRVSTFLADEFDGRKTNHYIEYEKRLNAISADSVSFEAKKFFDKKELFTVIVADTSQIKNSPEWNGFSFEKLNPKIISAKDLEENFGIIK